MPTRRDVDPRALEELTIDAMCVAVGQCENCPINAAMRRRAMDCVQFQERFPMEAVEIARKWKEAQGDGNTAGNP